MAPTAKLVKCRNERITVGRDDNKGQIPEFTVTQIASFE